MKYNIKTIINNLGGDPIKPKIDPPVNPEKNVPTKPDKNPDPTKIIPGVNDPEKADPTRIDDPNKKQESKAFL